MIKMIVEVAEMVALDESMGKMLLLRIRLSGWFVLHSLTDDTHNREN